MSEKEFQAQVLELARLCGWRVYHTHDSRRSAAGFPDLVLVKKQSLLFAELKTDTRDTTPEQQVWLEDLRAAGQEVHIWRPGNWATIQERLMQP